MSRSEKRYVIPPAVQATRMQRYSIYLILIAFLILGLNYRSLTIPTVLWFAAGLCATFALLCAAVVIMLQGLAWNFERMREEMSGARKAQELGSPDPSAPRRSSSQALTT